MTTSSVVDGFAKNWWVLLIRGILAVLFGFMAYVLPGLTLVTLVLLFGVYAFADGLTAVWVGGSSRAWWLVFAGLLGVIAGVLTFFYPGITAIALFYLIAVWAIARGIFEIVAAIQLRKEISKEWMLIISGLLSALFGVSLIVFPAAGAVAVVWLIGLYAVMFGVMMIAFAFRMRGLRAPSEKPATAS